MDQLFAGESAYIEYKRQVPANSIKYMKTIVAFANGKGGKVVFGIEDQTGKIVGIDSESVFQTMDSITNAISDSCEPAIIPDVSLRTVEDKTIIVVDICAGRQKPYYIKSLGIREGTFYRAAGTTRPVEDYMLKELILEGQNRHYDQEACQDLTISSKEIEALCSELKAVALKNSLTDEEKSLVKEVIPNTLLSWGILTEKDGHIIPTNAYALLTNQAFNAPKIQCGVFKGTNRAVFVDRREMTGPIQHQVEAAYQYVLEKINLGAKINGLYRQDVYEFPIGSIRELIANAVAHRSYLEPGNIQVALYDNRLEITSPGMILNGVSIEKMKEGYSKIRNRGIANAFSYMKIIENWGSGIPRMIKECLDYGLAEPELIDLAGDFRVNLYRGRKNADRKADTLDQTDQTDQTNQTNQTAWTDPEIRVLSLIKKAPQMTNAQMAQELGWNVSRVKYYLQKLKNSGTIKRQGSTHHGYWELLE